MNVTIFLLMADCNQLSDLLLLLLTVYCTHQFGRLQFGQEYRIGTVRKPNKTS